MKNDILKIMILHKDKVVRKILKEEILKILPYTLFLTASTEHSFFKKVEWMKPDIVLSDITKNNSTGLEALIYVRKNLAGVPFIFIINQFQTRNDELSLILREADGTINYTKPSQVTELFKNLLPGIERFKDIRSAEIIELYQQLMFAQKSIALSTKGHMIPRREAYLKSLANGLNGQ